MSETERPGLSYLRGTLDGIRFVDITFPNFGSCRLRFDKDIASLAGMFVREDVRRIGIGSELFYTAIGEAVNAKCLALAWMVRRDNVVAIEFYQKRGAVIFYGSADEYWMGINLVSGNGARVVVGLDAVAKGPL